MSLMDTNSNGMVMPVGPMYGNGGFGNSTWGDGSFWIIVLFLFAIMGNNNGFGGWGGNGMMPYMMNNNTNNDVQRGFDQQALTSGIAANTAAINAMQSATTAGLNTVAMNLQNCCCENRAATADLKYTVASEAAATRANCDANSRAVMDKLCQLELDGVKQRYEDRIANMQNQIDNLRTQVSNDRFDASQNNQTATIQAGQRVLANEIEQYVLPTPRPAYVVQNPNCCQNAGWGNCGGFVG